MAEKQGNILIVDDDKDVLFTAELMLKRKFKRIDTASDPHKLQSILESHHYEIVLLDMNFTAGFTSGKEGIRWLKKIGKISPSTRVILMTAYGDIDLAVQAMKEGASDFVVKPWENARLLEVIHTALEQSWEGAAHSMADLKNAQGDYAGMLGESAAMEAVFNAIDKVGATDANVLILGENGAGKELVAKALHQKSPRCAQAFVHVDLGAVPESLFEAELFGHVKGAFTDAREDREGRFEAARKGTLFLDEIGNLSLAMQSKLLTAIQNKRITRVGSNRPVDLDVRLLCATNVQLYDMVAEQKFRQDLLYRINTIEISLPPLRERAGDIELLARHFLEVYKEKYHRSNIRLAQSAIKNLQTYAWPGNIRELQHTIERAVIMTNSGQIKAEDFSINHRPSSASTGSEEKAYNLEEVEKEAIKNAIQKHNGNLSRAAKELGLGRTTLYRKMTKYDL